MGDTPRRGLRSAKVSTRMLAMVVVPVSLLAGRSMNTATPTGRFSFKSTSNA
jgi:hypothetical protein